NPRHALFSLNLLRYSLVVGLTTSLPLWMARSCSKVSQWSVSCQNIFFISAIASGLVCARELVSRAIDSSMLSSVGCNSAYKPFLLAQSALRHKALSIANWLKEEVPIFLSIAGPTTK